MNQSFHNTNAADANASGNDKIPSPEEIRNAILKKLVDTGEKDKLKEMLSDRLTQSGWRDDLKEHCKNIIRKKGLEKITVEELVSEITPYGRSTVPNEIKVELLDRIRAFLHVENQDDNDLADL